MTFPNQPPPSGAYVEGDGEKFGSLETDAKIRGRLKNPALTAYGKGQTNLWGSGGFLGFLTQGIFGIIGGVADFIGGFLGLRNKADHAANQVIEQAGSIADLDTRVTALEGGGTRTVYSGNDTWVNPGSGRIGIGAFNGGSAGRDGAVGSTVAVGGVDGSYLYREYNCADLPATCAIVIGAGGSINGQLGGQTSFNGTMFQPQQGAPGSILTPEGALSSSSAPGSGGNGGNTSGPVSPEDGEATALAAGGIAGIVGNRNGKPGGSVSVDSDVPCGGGGGGGGEAGNIAQNAGYGGAGGAPGGAGGGAGGHPNTNPGGKGFGGPGGNGRMIISHTPGAAA